MTRILYRWEDVQSGENAFLSEILDDNDHSRATGYVIEARQCSGESGKSWDESWNEYNNQRDAAQAFVRFVAKQMEVPISIRRKHEKARESW